MANEKGVPGIVVVSGEPHELVPSSEGGKFVCTRLRDKAVLQILPDGKSNYADAGTDGAYERCTLDGDELIFAYNDDPASHEDHKSRQCVHYVAWKKNIPVLS